MATFAVIEDGIVENIIVAESQEIAEEVTIKEETPNKICVEIQQIQPGWTYANGVFAPSVGE
jgi:hypothetical protein